MSRWRIVCDAGGTNVRIGRAMIASRKIEDLQILSTLEVASLGRVIADYAARWKLDETFDGAAIAAAGPAEGDALKLTNANLCIDAREISGLLHRPVRLMNDLEAVAWAVPHFSLADLVPVCDVAMPLAGPKLVVNIGTGFGAAVLIDNPSGRFVIGCEPGHMKLAGGPGGIVQDASTAELSVENVLSGAALADQAKRERLWGWRDRLDAGPAHLFQQARLSGEGLKFLAHFSALFGQVCGDLVLATGAWGGVYTCGSVVAAWLPHANRERFTAAFRDKGPMAPRMARTGVNHIATPHPALIGLAVAPLPS